MDRKHLLPYIHHIHIYIPLYILIHTFYITVCQANSYQCSKLTPEDWQGTSETCRVAKIKRKNLLKLTSSWLLIYILYIIYLLPVF
jgi:predicted nucleic acid-binding Zn ribbon protein